MYIMYTSKFSKMYLKLQCGAGGRDANGKRVGGASGRWKRVGSSEGGEEISGRGWGIVGAFP